MIFAKFLRRLQIMTTFHIQQFGCRATQADGAALERQLLDRGYTPAPDPATASIVVLNTCTVTAAADAQARDAIRKIHAHNPAAQLIVTGCYAQRAPEELATLPGVSWVVGNSHKPQIPALITQIVPVPINSVGAGLAPPSAPHIAPIAATGASQSVNVIPGEARNPLFPPTPPPAPSHLVGTQFIAPIPRTISNPSHSPHPAQILSVDIFAHPEFLSAPIQGGESQHTRPILKIQDGCNNRCSFCVIPYVRGKSRSLAPDAVIREINSLVAQALLPVPSPSSQPSQGVLPTPGPVGQPILAVSSSISSTSSTSSISSREIVLSGINLGTYGRDLSPRSDLLELLRRILDETPLERLRISSIEPQDVTQDLIDLFASTDHIAQHFHMPLQSASDPILAAMHRWYRSEHYVRRLDLIHDRLPHAAIGADVIAGFPGESESDHAATLNFIDRHRFTYLHVFSYSPRPGTKAASMPNQVPAATIKRRARELRALSESKSAAFRHSQLHRTLRVLTLNRRESPESVHPASEHAGTSSSSVTAYTPALSSNYLRVQVLGIHPSNQWQDVVITAEEGNYVIAEPVRTFTELSVSSVLSASSV
jgi:threonylcarbamoyladenosine tRNA methylthiotransferase MtaB